MEVMVRAIIKANNFTMCIKLERVFVLNLKEDILK